MFWFFLFFDSFRLRLWVSLDFLGGDIIEHETGSVGRSAVRLEESKKSERGKDRKKSINSYEKEERVEERDFLFAEA